MIERHDRDGIVTLRLAHGKANAMDLELLQAFGEALEEVETSDARGLIITGTGSIFSAGVDLFRLVDEGADYVRQFFPALIGAIGRLFIFPKPVVVAANGHSIAGGCLFVMCGDYRLMADGNGRIGVPELLVGVPFPAMALEIVRFAAPQHFEALVYTGMTITPPEALARGLVHEVVAPGALMERAETMARQLAAIPLASFALAKQQLRRETVERAMRLSQATDGDALAVWSAPEIHEHIRSYLARTVGRK